MMSKPTAVNLYSVRRQLIADFEGTLSKRADMGYDGVEPMVFGTIPLEVLPEDLRVPSPGTPLRSTGTPPGPAWGPRGVPRSVFSCNQSCQRTPDGRWPSAGESL